MTADQPPFCINQVAYIEPNGPNRARKINPEKANKPTSLSA